MHYVFLTGVAADTPARAKVAKASGHSARLACLWCALKGDNSDGTMRYKGYAQPALTARGCRSKVGDRGLPYTDEEQRSRDALVDADPEKYKPEFFGTRGTSVFVKELSYVSPNSLWLLPVAHALISGVLPRFWGLVLATFKKEETPPAYVANRQQRKVMRERAKDISVPFDIGRLSKCVFAIGG